MQIPSYDAVRARKERNQISGMIYRSGNTDEPQGPGEKYQKDSYRTLRAKGAASDTFKLVFDVPAQAKGLKLWFQDYPLIDLGLD